MTGPILFTCMSNDIYDKGAVLCAHECLRSILEQRKTLDTQGLSCFSYF